MIQCITGVTEEEDIGEDMEEEEGEDKKKIK
jgi:hypothetical protein